MVASSWQTNQCERRTAEVKVNRSATDQRYPQSHCSSGYICCNLRILNYEGRSSPDERKSGNIGMPVFKGRSRTVKAEATFREEAKNTLPCKDKKQEKSQSDVLKGNMPPHLSTLKFHLKDLEAVAIRQSDYLEEGVEYTSLPVHKTKGAQTITLPMNMPVVEGKKCFRRKGESSPNLKDRVNSSFTEESRVSVGSRNDGQGDTNCTVTENTNDTRCSTGKWLNDIDKLIGFKAKRKVEIFNQEKKEIVKQWTSSPKNFYKCILKCRQKQLSISNGLRTTKRRSREGTKNVAFPLDVLLFSAIEENASSELAEIIETNKIDVNLCRNSRGRPPLHRAVQLGAVDCVRVLLNNSADVNLRDSTNSLAVSLAISARQFECLVLLIESGASVGEYTSQRLKEYEDVQVLSKSCYRAFEVNV